MIRLTPRSTRTYTLFPHTTLFLSFYLVPAASENGRAAAGAEEPSGVVARFAFDRHRVAREYRGGVEQRAVVLAAIEAVADADAARLRSEEHTSDIQSLMRISYAVFLLNNKT